MLSLIALLGLLATASTAVATATPTRRSANPNLNVQLDARTLPASAPYAKLAQTYAPLIRFHFLARVYLQDGNGVRAPSAPSPLTTSNLDFLRTQGRDDSTEFLWVDGNVKADPSLPPETAFLYGSKAMDGVPIYAFVAPKRNGVVDLIYWHYSPYNLGKSTPLGRVGNHVGDWEHVVVRTVNGVATALDYHAHGGDGVRVVPANDKRVQWVEGHPVVYTALGSHGMWPQAGKNVYKSVAIVYDLVDDTGDGGVQWRTWGNVQTIAYKPNGGYTGNDAWLNYKGRYGNKADNSCWFHGIVGECLLTDGPTGPARDFMNAPLAHVLATPSSRTTITFRLDASAASFARANGLNGVGVHVFCPGSSVLWSKGDEERWTVVTLKSDLTYTVSVDACSSGRSRYVDRYEVALCGSSGDAGSCTKRSGYRSVRTFENGVQVKKLAVAVDDLDDWAWGY
ncbi:Vacuolar protein sorting-associated protein 62 [Phlyctochytrium bullatum]|nr:Vacuolar protein sorting-associated protein 62 [Phlyctochytrium bullatum]